MTLYQFIALDEQEQAEAVWDAVHIAERWDLALIKKKNDYGVQFHDFPKDTSVNNSENNTLYFILKLSSKKGSNYIASFYSLKIGC